jgi:hypothetical protein
MRVFRSFIKLLLYCIIRKIWGLNAPHISKQALKFRSVVEIAAGMLWFNHWIVVIGGSIKANSSLWSKDWLEFLISIFVCSFEIDLSSQSVHQINTSKIEQISPEKK